MAPIRPLPPETIDRIAAGEVIQRPSAIIKELIENSLDASSTQIDVSSSGLDVSVSDNGCGMDKDTLHLACRRFATSKIVDFEDLKTVRTFGFRGEALASCSMVGRVIITSRRRGDRCAYRMSFRDGAPVNDTVSASAGKEVEPKPCAGKEGTTIQVQDLFYNVPSRRKAMEGRRNEREEYDRILSVVQRYAVHEARRGVGFLCRGNGGKGGKQCDLNTASLSSVKKVIGKKKEDNDSSSEKGFGDEEIAAVKDVIGHVFGSDVVRELLPLSAGQGNVTAVGIEALKAMVELSDRNLQYDQSKEAQHEQLNKSEEENNRILLEEMMKSVSDGLHNQSESTQPNKTSESTEPTTKSFSFAYKATGLITNGSYSASKSQAAFLLFINDRLVESPSLRRAVESIYADTLPKGGKPFVYLSLELPGPHVDVNVHPTKKEVAFLHEDRLCEALMNAVKEVVGSATSSRTFVVAGSKLLRPEKEKVQSVLVTKQDAVDVVAENKNDSESNPDNDTVADGEKVPNGKAKRKLDPDMISKHALVKKPYDPSRLVRTNRAALAGALEPFLVKKIDPDNVSFVANAQSKQQFRHEPKCPLANQSAPDMNLPGAFATAICRCQVKGGDNLPPVGTDITVRSIQTNIVRPKRVMPTDCEYDSIKELRAEVSDQNHQSLNETLRASTYVGAVTRSQSLIQSGIDLLMINHRELARETFYQLALLKFGGMPMAELGDGVHVMTVIGDYLQSLETEDLDDTSKLDISKPNTSLARKTVSCLAEKAPMLQDYFSIKLERRMNEKSKKESLWLTGLPILLDGHSPQPYALPLFLIRLTAEVDWTAEKTCFRGICKELASFYSELPMADTDEDLTADGSTNKNVELIEDEAKSYVKHTLYPVVSHLLVPPTEFAANGTVIKLANLTSLYKVFERC